MAGEAEWRTGNPNTAQYRVEASIGRAKASDTVPECRAGTFGKKGKSGAGAGSGPTANAPGVEFFSDRWEVGTGGGMDGNLLVRPGHG
jgi:hypothetical protein